MSMLANTIEGVYQLHLRLDNFSRDEYFRNRLLPTVKEWYIGMCSKAMKNFFGGKSQTPQRKEELREEGDDQLLWGTKVILNLLEKLPNSDLPLKFLHRNNKPTMENPPPRCKFPVILFAFSLFFCLISFVLCIVAEFQRNKQDDLRWNGRLCHAPLSPSYGLGIAALACLALAQLLGNFIFFKHSSGGRANAQFKIPVSAKVLILISWLSCVFAIQVLMIAISMSKEQKYGRGWLNGECYLVKGGIFVGSAILALVSIGSITASTFSTMKCTQTMQNRKAYS